MTPPPARPVATVARALAVLGVLAESSDDVGNNEIARRIDTNPSTVSRMLATLADAELVTRASDSGRFRLGPRLVELGNAALARVDLRQLARPHLVAITEATGETTTLCVQGEQSLVTVDFVQSPSSVRSVAEVGRRSAAHATAIGKVYLAHGGRLPSGRLTSYTARTTVDRQQVAAEVERVRERGWAQAAGEREDDLNAVAAPVLDSVGHLVAVLGIQGPASRFGRRAMQTAADCLLRHAVELGRVSGR